MAVIKNEINKSRKKEAKKNNDIKLYKNKSNKVNSKTNNKVKDKIHNEKVINKNKYWLFLISILIIIIVIVLLFFLNIEDKKKKINYALRESTVMIDINESQIDMNQYEEEPESTEYTLRDFSNILEARGSNVSIENISNNGKKIYNCLISTSNGIYEEFSGEAWMSPIVMNVERYDGTEVLVSAKRMASNERIVYCDWYMDDKCYQVVSLEVDDIGDYLSAINNYILSK